MHLWQWRWRLDRPWFLVLLALIAYGCSSEVANSDSEAAVTNTTTMDANEILQSLCDKYQAAVNANDSAAYKKLFALDAIRIPPGLAPEHGPDDIAASEQKDYDVATWKITSTAHDALLIDDDWLYGVAMVDAQTTAHADGAVKEFQATKTWLLQRQSSGEWLIKRQMWNLR